MPKFGSISSNNLLYFFDVPLSPKILKSIFLQVWQNYFHISPRAIILRKKCVTDVLNLYIRGCLKIIKDMEGDSPAIKVLGLLKIKYIYIIVSLLFSLSQQLSQMLTFSVDFSYWLFQLSKSLLLFVRDILYSKLLIKF